jgi:HD superfamily phosphohydrolase
MGEKIILKDPLYKQILFDKKFVKYLDLKEFQRLRYIKQVTFVDMVYPNANHSRFSHSLGVYNLMNEVINNGLMNISKEDREALLLASLFHDIGHGPFSHIWERIFPDFNHEKISMKFLKKMGLNSAIEILEGKSKYSKLLSSTIDVDKLDYMARDSYFAGVSYGVSETNFIIQHLFVKEGKICIKASAISSVEDLITQRVNLFKTVYFHKFAIYYDFLFLNIFKRVKYLLDSSFDIEIDDNLLAFFKKRETIENLYNLNDIIIQGMIFKWSKSEDKILREFCECFLYRKKKFHIVNLKYDNVNIDEIKKKVGEKYDMEYYFDHKCYPINILQSDIYVDLKSSLVKLEEISDLIKFYKTQKWNCEFLIYPKDIVN